MVKDVSLRVEKYRKRKNATQEGRSALLAQNRNYYKRYVQMKKYKTLRLKEDIAAYEDELRQNGINVPPTPEISGLQRGSTNGHDQKSSTTQVRNNHMPPLEELKSMPEEDLFKWKKEKRQERARDKKRAQRSRQKQLICNLEERVSMLKNLYDQNQKPGMPDVSKDKISDPSGENPENVRSNSNNEITPSHSQGKVKNLAHDVS
eukprot:CAMPEP_0181079162 /NCGR_PEP_ID=MMETSP1071-20121207/1879_1 /TAXON_ID=35127 /ORGANISM="Thalassiosira sp., Strain NH16" /LENGTH=204 /DNA_ID=CAMNT_0023160539 /DNA_START=161 /DNA_END=773 /DNA_ORIENTATION=-